MSLRSASHIKSLLTVLKSNPYSLLICKLSIYHSRFMQPYNNSLSAVDPNLIIALDCEYVGTGPRGSVSALGRASIVGYDGQILLDIFSKPDEPVTDHRTPYSGLTPNLLQDGVPITEALYKLRNELKGKIIIGHGIFADLKILGITHPSHYVRDTARFVGLVELYNQKAPTSAFTKKPTTEPLSWYSARGNERSQLASSAPDLTETSSANALFEASLSPVSQPTPSTALSESLSVSSSGSCESTPAVPSRIVSQPVVIPEPQLQPAVDTSTHTGNNERRKASTRAQVPQSPALYVKHGVSLQRMSLVLLGRRIQQGSHDSVEDARASLDLYRIVEIDFEEAIRRTMPALRAPPWRY